MAEVVELPEIPLTERVVLDPVTTALIVVDMQHDFVADGGALQVPDAAATVPVIAGLLRAARSTGTRVVFTQDTHRDDDLEFRIWPPHARVGTWGWELVEGLEPLHEETVLRKPRYDAFYGTPLDHLLRTWGVTTVVLCGTVANICVLGTAASAALRWYDVVVVADGVSALHPFDLAAALRQTTSLLAGRVTTAAGLALTRASTGP